MSQKTIIEKKSCCCDKMQKRVTLEVTIISELLGTPKVEVYRKMRSIKCDGQDESCPEWCEAKERARKLSDIKGGGDESK